MNIINIVSKNINTLNFVKPVQWEPRCSTQGLDYERLHLSAHSHANCHIYALILQVISLSHTADLQNSNTIWSGGGGTPYILISIRNENKNRISRDPACVCIASSKSPVSIFSTAIHVLIWNLNTQNTLAWIRLALSIRSADCFI